MYRNEMLLLQKVERILLNVYDQLLLYYSDDNVYFSDNSEDSYLRLLIKGNWNVLYIRGL